MEKRECLPCTACCDGWLSSKHIDMSPGKPCQHRCDDGCAIYRDRPQDPCRSFQCEWVRRAGGLPAGLRPDLCGAIVLSGREFHGWKVIIATPTAWKIPRETLRQVMQYARSRNLPLIWIENFHAGGRYTHFSRSGYGPGEFMKVIGQHSRGLDLIQI